MRHVQDSSGCVLSAVKKREPLDVSFDIVTPKYNIILAHANISGREKESSGTVFCARVPNCKIKNRIDAVD